MALAILAVKTLSTLESERRRFAILYRLGVDTRMQKSAVRKQIGAFFLMPFAFPLLMTIPVGGIFGKIYEIWNLSGLSGGKAMWSATNGDNKKARKYRPQRAYFFIYGVICTRKVYAPQLQRQRDQSNLPYYYLIRLLSKSD